MWFWIVIIIVVVLSGISMAGKAEKAKEEISEQIIELESNRIGFSKEDNETVVRVLEAFRTKSSSSKLKSAIYVSRKSAMSEVEEHKRRVIEVYKKMKEKYDF